MGIAENKSDRRIGSIEMKKLYNSLDVNEMQQTNKRSGQKYTLKMLLNFIIGFALIKSKFIIIIDDSSMSFCFVLSPFFFKIANQMISVHDTSLLGVRECVCAIPLHIL